VGIRLLFLLKKIITNLGFKKIKFLKRKKTLYFYKKIKGKKTLFFWEKNTFFNRLPNARR
jgi:hypothetical protein